MPNKYKVFRVYKASGRRSTLRKGLSLQDAKKVVDSYPSSEKSMVCFTRE
jgi:ribosomal protein L7/L12